MTGINQSLCQSLLLLKTTEGIFELSCKDCFALLKYNAYQLAAGASSDEIFTLVNHHLSLYSDCKVRYDEWINKIINDKSP